MDRASARPPAAMDPRIGFWLLAGLLAAFAAAKAVQADTLDPDCFWHLRVADQLHGGPIGPIVDHLSFASRSQPWTPYSWAAELGMRALWRAGGYRAAVAAQAVMEAAFMLLLAGAAGEAVGWRGLTGAAVATAAGLYLSLPYLSFRPVTLALVGLAGCAWLVLRGNRLGTRAAWWTVPITIGLANIHLYALLVPAAAVLWAVGERLDRRPARRAVWLAIALAAASLATPMLPGVCRTALFYSTGDGMVSGPVIAEMRPWGRDAGSVLTLVALLACAVRACGRLPTGALLWVGGAAALTLKLGRFAPVLAIAAGPSLAVGLASLSDRLLGRRPVALGLAAVLVACVARLAMAFPRADVPLSAWLNRLGPDVPGYPCAAADFVADHVPPVTGHLINEFTWGGYLSWRLGDRWQVLLDGRTQVYPAALWHATYLGTGDDCRAFLSTVHADAAIVPTGRSRFSAALVAEGWTVVHRDAWAEVLVPGASTADVRQ
jgi:hypothetical protein